MKSKQELWSIFLAGHWNRMIFTPEYVGKKFFHQAEVETQIALLPIFPITYRHAQVVLEASMPGLVFRPRFDSEESLLLVEEMALTALNDLPNTPLSGVGVNFAFTEANPRADLLELFDLGDGTRIGGAGWEANETVISRKFNHESGVLNLTLSYDTASLDFMFNFHTDTTDNVAAKAAIERRVRLLREAAVRFMKEIYDLPLEKSDADE